MLLFWDMLLVLLDACIWMALGSILRRDPARFSRRVVYAICAVAIVLEVGLYPLYLTGQAETLNTASRYSGLMWILFLPLPIFLYPKNLWKNLTLHISASIIVVTASGIANLLELSTGVARPVNLLVRVLINGVLLGLVWLITRHVFPGLYDGGDKKTWRRLAAILAFLGVIGVVAAGAVVTQRTLEMPYFVPIRVCGAAMAVIILYIAGLAQLQAKQTAETQAQEREIEDIKRQKDEEYSRIVEGVEKTQQMWHDRRQMFTAMQGMNTPGREAELDAYCGEVLDAMQNNRREVSSENH